MTRRRHTSTQYQVFIQTLLAQCPVTGSPTGPGGRPPGLLEAPARKKGRAGVLFGHRLKKREWWASYFGHRPKKRAGRASPFGRRPEPGQDLAPRSRPFFFLLWGQLIIFHYKLKTSHFDIPIIQERAPGCRLFALVTLSFKFRAMDLGVLCGAGAFRFRGDARN